MIAEKPVVRFIKFLVSGATAQTEGHFFVIATKSGRAKLEVLQVEVLVSAGLVSVKDAKCFVRPEARSWLKRQIADRDQHAAQHRTLTQGTDEVEVNVSESPLARLAFATKDKPAFLAPHHVLAGERIRGLVERANMVQHVTMSYDPTHLPSSTPGSAKSNLSDMVMDARQALANINQALPSDCAGVVFDVCGYLKGLQQVETERRWPRRSAKLVLRIGLDQAAAHFGFSPVASGVETHRGHHWLGPNARPTEYG